MQHFSTVVHKERKQESKQLGAKVRRIQEGGKES